MTSKTPVSQFLGSVAVVLYDKLLPPSSPISFSFSLPSPTLPSRRRKATSGTNTFSYLSETVSLNLELTQWARLAGEQASEICLAPHWHARLFFSMGSGEYMQVLVLARQGLTAQVFSQARHKDLFLKKMFDYHLFVCTCVCVHGVIGVSNPWELEKRAYMSCLMWGLGIELGSSSRAVCS